MKKYLQDKTLFLLSLVHTSIGLLSTLYPLLKVDGDKSALIVRYRPSLGLSGSFVQGSATDVYAFSLVAIFICVCSVFFAYKVYAVKREYSVLIIVLGLVLALCNARVMYAIIGIK